MLNRKFVILIIIIIPILIFSWFLFYSELSPVNQNAATGRVFYLSPNGNDSNLGTDSSPWKTFNKANNTIKSGDIVILKDGVYPGYQEIKVSGTTWKAENQHKAILDGGFSPADLKNNWNNIVPVWDAKCKNGVGQYKMLLAVTDQSNITVDGLFLRNSCGRGFGVWTTQKGYKSENVTFINNHLDWTFNGGVFAAPLENQLNSYEYLSNFRAINNIFTRTSFADEYHRRTSKYKVNAMMFNRGTNGLFKGNIVAWSHGEISAGMGAHGVIIEDNLIVGVKNFLYVNTEQDITIRNNTFVGLEDKQYGDTFMGSQGSGTAGDWRSSTRNEEGFKDMNNLNKNIAIYNNLYINVSMFFSGYNREWTSDTKDVYFGHNTLIAGKDTRKQFDITFGSNDGSNPNISATIENNLFYKGKNPAALIQASYDSGDRIIFRNNIWPIDVTNSVKGPGDVYTNDPGMLNQNLTVSIKPPSISDKEVGLEPIFALKEGVYQANYSLKPKSPAINKGFAPVSNIGGIPREVLSYPKERDFAGRQRDNIPDIGAFEYGGIIISETPTPIVTTITTPLVTLTPSITNTVTPTYNTTDPTYTPIPSNTPITGNICDKSDVDSNGVFTIADFSAFAIAYGNGKNTCSDVSVDYGPCGGRDVNKDGKLNIADFGGSGIGFAQRYYPKTSCIL